MKIKKLSLIIFLLIALSSCVSRLEKRGYVFDLSGYELLQEGVTNKEKVLKIMGSPTLISDLDNDEAWIYYAEDVENFLFFKPDIKDRNILVLRFNESETIKELKKISFANEEKRLSFVSSYTNVESHKVGFFKLIFSNVGQIKAQ